MLKKVDHVCIVVKDLDDSLKFYEQLFGLKPSKVETLSEQAVKAALLPIGNTEIELIQPIDNTSGVARFLETRGEGIHHVCLEVDDVDKELATLSGKGVQLVDKQGRNGLAGKVAFLHPKSTRGVLIELAQKVH